MVIYLVSSLAADDENRLAPEVLAAIGGVLDRLAVSYSVRIRTTTGDAIHRNRTAICTDDADRSTGSEYPEPPVN